MKIRTTLVGIVDQHRTLDWPEGWPVPREGEAVDLRGPGVGGTDEVSLSVRTVVWYPEGSADDPEPLVYLVIGPARR